MKRIKPSVPTIPPAMQPPGESGLFDPYAGSPGEEQVSSLPIPHIPPLIREMNESAKRKMAQALEFPFAFRGARKWPEALFAKSILDLSVRARSSLELRRKLAEVLLAEIRPLLQAAEPPFSPVSFDENPEFWMLRHGKWHCYWALYFYAVPQGDEMNEDVDRRRLQQLAARPAVEQPTEAVPDEPYPAPEPAAVPEARGDAAGQRRIEKLNRRIETLEERVRREEERARRLEKEAAEARREAVALEERSSSLERELEAERRRSDRLSEERETAAGRLAELKRQHRQERSRLEAELAEARRGIESAEALLQAERQRGAGGESGFGGVSAGSVAEAEFRGDRTAAEPDNSEAAIRGFDALLRRDLREAGAELPGEGEPGDLEARAHLRRALDLLDAVGAYAAGRRPLRGEPADDMKMPKPEAMQDLTEEKGTPHGMTEAPKPSEAQRGAFGRDGQAGTFHRRDHGGYIVLDGGETFNITESMVYKHQLQHDAEVWCTPRQDGLGGTQYEIELLFQGDDAFSPVRQYNGYVELDQYGIWQAVDMNDAERRFPIHAKDLEIQRPADGAPCIFNVGEEESIARLARVYRDFSDPEALPRRESPGAGLPSSPSPSKPKRETRKNKPEPFLKGCTVVVLGGQRKWFEEVVVESGANYVHENGERPDLIASDLRKAQALFLLITSTSHRASWEGIELAKAAGIPYFIIQGSKSNLRSMLWENRDAILHANRGGTA